MKNIAIFGSTGSIGRNALEVVKSLNLNGFPVKVKYLTANSNASLLRQQITEFRPSAVAVNNRNSYEDLKNDPVLRECEILYGQEGLTEISKRDDYTLAVNALVGFSGLLPTLECIKSAKDIALANKESLVVAGELISGLLKQSGSNMLPVDSEHSAIMQCIRGESLSDVRKIILTASGGALRNYPKESLSEVTVEEALNHPNWKMGNKITIDSATLMNKGLEIIEAKWLFGLDVDKIEVLVHPQSIIHSLVEFSDGSVKAQMGIPDMKIPIQYAITYPMRINSDYQSLELKHISTLTFEKPDYTKYECLGLAYEVIRQGGTYPVVLNGSNEAAVELFLNRKIRFTDIPNLIKSALDSHSNHTDIDIETIIETDKWSRRFVYESAALIH
jgi:1-deoxy-D-xylulose-5-phosphate reductoisomerase